MTMAMMTIHNTTQSLCTVEIMNRSSLQINPNLDMTIHPQSNKVFKLPRPGEELYILCCSHGCRLHVTQIRANMFLVNLNGAITVVDRPMI